MMHEVARGSHRTARMLAARIARDTKMRPTKRRAQFDTTISPIINPERAVKQIFCAILCDLVRFWVGGFKTRPYRRGTVEERDSPRSIARTERHEGRIQFLQSRTRPLLSARRHSGAAHSSRW